MPKRQLDNWLKSYLQYTQYSEAPQKFHFWTGVSTIAGALRRRVWIDQVYFQWTPNFYIVFVAPPGIVSKSTTASIGMRLLKQISDIRFGPDAVTWQALTEALAMSTEEPMNPATKLTLPMSCITISSSEFGTFLDPKDREMVDVLVSLWDGQLGTWEKATKTQGSDLIVNPWINMNACTTPAWIAENFPRYMVGGGFTSRCVFVYADEKRHLVAYPATTVPVDLGRLEKALVHDLGIISNLMGEYSLAPDALEYGELWYAKHYEATKAHVEGDNQKAGYKARKQTHIHKLAIVVAASRRDELIITAEDLDDAANIVTELEKDMPKVFRLIGASESARYTEAIHNIVRQHKTIERKALVRELVGVYSAKEIDEGMKTCIDADIVRLMNVQGKTLVVDTDSWIQARKEEEEEAIAETQESYGESSV